MPPASIFSVPSHRASRLRPYSALIAASRLNGEHRTGGKTLRGSQIVLYIAEEKREEGDRGWTRRRRGESAREEMGSQCLSPKWLSCSPESTGRFKQSAEAVCERSRSDSFLSNGPVSSSRQSSGPGL